MNMNASEKTHIFFIIRQLLLQPAQSSINLGVDFSDHKLLHKV